MRKILATVSLVAISGCSATTLRCGIAEGDSYVDLVNVPQNISAQARHFKDLCAFAYEETTQ